MLLGLDRSKHFKWIVLQIHLDNGSSFTSVKNTSVLYYIIRLQFMKSTGGYVKLNRGRLVEALQIFFLLLLSDFPGGFSVVL